MGNNKKMRILTKNEKITINNKRVLKMHVGNIKGIGWI
jgi:hypothetical protein